MIQNELPLTLLELLSNTLVLDQTLPYLPLPTILRIAALSKAFKRLIYETPRVFRYLDLSRCRGAYVAPSLKVIDSGRQNGWRQGMDEENLTEDEFHSAPLRGIITSLSKRGVMRDVQTLVLDGVGSVTHDVLSNILMSDQYNVRLLSVLRCPNLNERKFQQLLHYLCRPSRPEGTPRLKGVYMFGRSETVVSHSQSRPLTSRITGITALPGAQIGSASSPMVAPSSSHTPTSNPWFSRTGSVLPEQWVDRGMWEDTLLLCNGIIAFDAVLCTHMHREMRPYRSNAMNAHLRSGTTSRPRAIYALGSSGCAGCGCVPKGAPVWGQSDLTAFPLVSPPPFSGRLVDAVRPPFSPTSEQQTLVVSCGWCLSDRYCQSCHRYWCGKCYHPLRRKRALQLEAQAEHEETDENVSAELRRLSECGGGGTSIKVYNGLCTQYCAFGEDLAAGNGAMWG